MSKWIIPEYAAQTHLHTICPIVRVPILKRSGIVPVFDRNIRVVIIVSKGYENVSEE